MSESQEEALRELAEVIERLAMVIDVQMEQVHFTTDEEDNDD